MPVESAGVPMQCPEARRLGDIALDDVVPTEEEKHHIKDCEECKKRIEKVRFYAAENL
ncbi:hypothetical protein KW796_03115 [Candidatus Parcubacteria bacterium]|nr:hypothetical protein [Candidatus Parcubacteria bacterium]